METRASNSAQEEFKDREDKYISKTASPQQIFYKI